jgi:hypothetical protein
MLCIEDWGPLALKLLPQAYGYAINLIDLNSFILF